MALKLGTTSPMAAPTSPTKIATAFERHNRWERKHYCATLFLVCSCKILFLNVGVSITSKRPFAPSEHIIMSLGRQLRSDPEEQPQYLRGSMQWGWPDEVINNEAQPKEEVSAVTSNGGIMYEPAKETTAIGDALPAKDPEEDRVASRNAADQKEQEDETKAAAVPHFVADDIQVEDGEIPEILLLAAKNNPRKYKDRMKRIKKWQEFGQTKVVTNMVRKALKELEDEQNA